MQNEIKIPSELLGKDGSLSQKGWSRKPLLNYNRKAVRASGFRIKEWDYYCILNKDYGIALTAANLGYLGLLSIVWLDFRNRDFLSESVMSFFPMGNWKLPKDSDEGSFRIEKSHFSLHFEKINNYRHISFQYPKFQDGKGMEGRLSLYQNPEQDSIVIATPFEKNNRAFYYNRKLNCMPVQGEVKIGGDVFLFKPEDSFGVLDWGRGIWTYKNTWYWGSASGLLKDKPFGFNIGCGFGDTSAASENIVFCDGVGHKLDEVIFQIPDESYLKPWRFSSNNGRFEMDFLPIIDRNSSMDFKILKSVQHQVFGLFSGFVVLDDGKKLEIKNLIGFAEKVLNWW